MKKRRFRRPKGILPAKKILERFGIPLPDAHEERRKKMDKKINFFLKLDCHARGMAHGEEEGNECGFTGRWSFEDTSRMLGWGKEGVGMCDYPQYCPLFREDKCPLGAPPPTQT